MAIRPPSSVVGGPMRPDRSRRPGLLRATALPGALQEVRPATGRVPPRPLLPDPFLEPGGTRVATASDRRCRRAGIREPADRSLHGRKPFVAGVFDRRIALTMPIGSGTGGVPAYRGIPEERGAQPPSGAFSEQSWLGDAWGPRAGNPGTLPVDTHEIAGVIAPRGLFGMENPHVDRLGARSGSVAAPGGAEIRKALGAGGDISSWPDVRDGTHCVVRPEWKTPLRQNLPKFPSGSGSGFGVFRIASGKAGDLAQWRDWPTPVPARAGGRRSGTGTGAGCRLEHTGVTTVFGATVDGGFAASAARACGSP
ncbi:glucuronyl esterase domain-containing protein [Streptomyces eurythermus]